jgi:hypothetical protein
MEADLQRAALEDRWPLAWPQYEEVFQQARESVEKRRFGRVLVEYGKLFDLLMAAIQQQRKLHQRENRPKKGSSPSMAVYKEAESNGGARKSNPEVKPPTT